MGRVASFLCAAVACMAFCPGCASLLGKKPESTSDHRPTESTAQRSQAGPDRRGEPPSQAAYESRPQVTDHAPPPQRYANRLPERSQPVASNLRDQNVPPSFRDRPVPPRRPVDARSNPGHSAQLVSAQRPPQHCGFGAPLSKEQHEARQMLRDLHAKGELDRMAFQRLDWVVRTTPQIASHLLVIGEPAAPPKPEPPKPEPPNSESEKEQAKKEQAKPAPPKSESAQAEKEAKPAEKADPPEKPAPGADEPEPPKKKSEASESKKEETTAEKPKKASTPKEEPSPNKAPEVQTVSAETEVKADAEMHWKMHVAEAAAAIERQLAKSAGEAAADPSSPQAEMRRVQQRIALRLLQLLAGDKNEALKPIDGLDTQQQDYWRHQLHGLAIQLDENGTPLDDHRWRLSLRSFREALRHLAAGSSLEVRSLTFCRQVDSYGRYVEFKSREFRPDQEVLLYAEIDNFTVEETAEGFETELQASYRIVSEQGHRVAEQGWAAEKEVCRNRRRDYFVPYRLYMPQTIAPGRYRLTLTVEDMKGNKFGQGSISFTIRD